MVGVRVGAVEMEGLTEGAAVDGSGVGYLVGGGDGFFVGAKVGALVGGYHLDGWAVG